VGHRVGKGIFENDIGHYNFRRWTANEVNRMLLVERKMNAI
jgi:hypothetical protein